MGRLEDGGGVHDGSGSGSGSGDRNRNGNRSRNRDDDDDRDGDGDGDDDDDDGCRLREVQGGVSVKALRATFGPQCHWCGLAMDFDAPPGRPESATIEHLNDATFGSLRQHAQHRRLAHAECNQARNAFRLRAERDFAQWLATRSAVAEEPAGAGTTVRTARTARTARTRTAPRGDEAAG